MTWATRRAWRLTVCLTVTMTLTLILTGSASAAEILWGLTANNTLVRFSSSAPGTILATLPITGLPGTERLVVIEVEWPEGRLTGFSNEGKRYEINRTTGAAVRVDPAQNEVPLPGTAFGATDDGSTLLVVSDTGAQVVMSKAGGSYVRRIPPSSASRIVALAWRNAGEPQRVAIDSATDALYEYRLVLDEPSVVSIGPLGVDTSDDAGLEFGPHDGVLYAALTVGGTPGLYTITPGNGQATLVGAIAAAPIVSLTADMQGTPQFTPLTAVVPEGDTSLTFSVRRTGDLTVAADYTLVSSSIGNPAATAGDDFVPVSEALHFAIGESEKTFSVTIRADAIREPASESFRLTLTETAPNQLAVGVLMITILDDDNQPPVLTVTSPSAVSVSSPTVGFTGLASDEDAGAVIKLFGPSGTPHIPRATTTGSPWSIANVALSPGLNAFKVVLEDIHGLTDSRDIFVWRSSPDDRTYVFAEGATGPFFTTDLLFANPNTTSVWVMIDFLREDGTVISHPLLLDPKSRKTLLVNTVPGLEATATAAVVRTAAISPIVVERTMRWDRTDYGASTEKAATDLSRTWYFAEGSQGVFFSTFLLLVNPQEQINHVGVTFLREGANPVTQFFVMEPRQRLTIDASTVPELKDTSFGIQVNFGHPAMAERSMYFGMQRLWDGGHESAGATAPATEWLLAEGATGAFFETFVLLANPSGTPADVTMTYLPEGGAPVTKKHQVPGSGRLTVNIEQEDAALANLGAVGTRVTSTVPIVVERSQYWPFSPDQWYEAHNSFAETSPATHWGLAEGRVGGAGAAHKTYILLTNPGTTAWAHVTITFLRENAGSITKLFDVAPASRLTVDVGSAQVPEITEEAFGADIVSDVPIAVERSVYWNVNGQFWAAGTNAAATRLP